MGINQFHLFIGKFSKIKLSMKKFYSIFFSYFFIKKKKKTMPVWIPYNLYLSRDVYRIMVTSFLLHRWKIAIQLTIIIFATHFKLLRRIVGYKSSHILFYMEILTRKKIYRRKKWKAILMKNLCVCIEFIFRVKVSNYLII